MKTAFVFDLDVAINVGLDEAIVLDWLEKRCVASYSEDRKACFQEGSWWCFCSKSVVEVAFPFWSWGKSFRMIDKLKELKFIDTRDSVTYKGAKLVTVIKTEFKFKKLAKQEEVQIYTYVRTIAGEKIEKTEPSTTIVAEMIDLFRHVNPSYKIFFGRKAQRQPLLEMMKEYSITELFKLLEVLPQTNGMQYAPTITTPLEFRRLAPKLVAFIEKKKSEQKSNKLFTI